MWTPYEILTLLGDSDTSTKFDTLRTVTMVSFVFFVAVAVTAMKGTLFDTKDRSSLNL